jgi:putative hydrolase of HD superfamily
VTEIALILDFLAFAERLKRELRHSWLSDGRQESVAEHTFQMALMALLLSPHLEHPVDLARTLKLVLAHDLVEAEAGDVPYFETGARKEGKARAEQAAIERIRAMLPDPTGVELHALWHEFEAGHTPEARFARALDHLEVQIQHNLAPLETWLPLEHELVYTKMDASCGHDRFLRAFCAAVRSRAENKLQAGGVDVIALRTRLGLGAPA